MPGILMQSGQLHRITGLRSDPALGKRLSLWWSDPDWRIQQSVETRADEQGGGQ
jgi:hypothetical protein